MVGKEWIVEGNVWKVGNNINTESITPSHWLHEGHAPMLAHLAEMLIPEFPAKMHQGDLWVAGTNLGCSSSRNAPLFLKDKGIGAIICASAARIFYRNALNSGIPIFTIGQDVEKIGMGDRVRVDVRKGRIEHIASGAVIQTKPFPDFVMAILEAGGITQYILAHKSEYSLLK